MKIYKEIVEKSSTFMLKMQLKHTINGDKRNIIIAELKKRSDRETATA